MENGLWEYTEEKDGIHIRRFLGDGYEAEVPSVLDGTPVRVLEKKAFLSKQNPPARISTVYGNRKEYFSAVLFISLTKNGVRNSSISPIPRFIQSSIYCRSVHRKHFMIAGMTAP